MASVDLETVRGLFKKAPEHSDPGPVCQTGQQSSDADHPPRTNIPSGFSLRGPQPNLPMPLPTPPSTRNPSWDDEEDLENLVEYRDAKVANGLGFPPPYVVSPQTIVDDYEHYGKPIDSLRLAIPPVQYIQEDFRGDDNETYAHLSTSRPLDAGETLPSSTPYSSPPQYPLDIACSDASLRQQPQFGAVRIAQSRPRPQCWEHGCNGRQFSTFSNLLRHQREKSGQATKATCPDCGAEFARTTARNGHLLHRKCRQKRAEPIAEIENPGQPIDSESSDAMIKEAQHSLSSTAASSPVFSPDSILTATGGLAVEQTLRARAALVPNDKCGPVPEEMPCDMSDMSEGESFETSPGSEGPNSPTCLAESRRDVLIDRTISWMVTWIDSKLSVLAFQTHGTCEESPRGSLPQSETCETTDGLSQKRRRGYYKEGRGPDDEGSDGEERVPPPSQGSDAVENEEIMEFACPFLKHNPRKFGQIRSCSASGWKAIFRLKEHLYRCHRLPSFQCIRCRTTFKSSEKLLQHSQAYIACNVVRDESGQEGISHEQLMKLKSRKRSREASSEHDRWINMYKILFPDDYLIPSPYFQRGNSGKGQESLLTAFREHVSRELPRLIRPRLEESVDATIREALGPDVLEGLVRDILSQVLSTFPQHKSETPAAMFGKKRKGETSQPTEMFPQLALPGSNRLALSDVSTFGVEPNASEAWVFSHQAGMEQTDSCQEKGQCIDNESLKWQMGCEDPTGMEPGPSNFLSADEHTYLPPAQGDNVIEASSLSDLFNFDEFCDEYAAWLGQADEGSSHADSGYFSSLQSVESVDYMAGKGKGKEIVREPGEHDIT